MDNDISEFDGIGIMPTFRDVYPQYGDVGEKFIIKHIKNLYLDDCLVILSRASRYYYKYYQTKTDKDNRAVYRRLCYGLLDPKTIQVLEECEGEKEYDLIFPELSILHLIKLCLQNCDTSGSTTSAEFPKETLFTIGKCLLVTNSLFFDSQLKGVPLNADIEGFVVNFTKQLIVDHNFDMFQKFYQTYFIFDIMSNNTEINLEEIFNRCYGVSVKEYLAFSFAILSQYMINNTENEDWKHPHLDASAMVNLKPQFQQKLLDDLLINNFRYKKIDLNFFNPLDITKRPFVRLRNGKIIVLSLKRLFLRLTDSVYFDILDTLTDRKEKDLFSKVYGNAVEGYAQDVFESIDSGLVKPFKYGKPEKETPDSMLAVGDDVVFFECKKKQFHTLEFLKDGNKNMFYERVDEFYTFPLQQLCSRIDDFRNKLFSIAGLQNDTLVYPVIISPLAPPIFSGGWDKLNLNERVLPKIYSSDKKIAPPEFMDLAELECIEEYLRLNPEKSFTDLIKIKRADVTHHNANWMVILYKNKMNVINSRLREKYLLEIKDFKEILFK